MSESREKKTRYNLRLQYISRFSGWMANEPPMWNIVAWRRWKKRRPAFDEDLWRE